VLKKQFNISLPFLLLLISSVEFFGCSYKPEPEQLPISVYANLNLLQQDPQFVMYLNFKSMRRTEFWKKNISDSLLNIEKTFGSLLNTFKMATGASVSEGIDELYYSNSWFGENSIVLKGIFDRKKLDNYLATDSVFSITKNRDGRDIYIKNDNGLYFYFKDDFTICASNYLKQIDIMMETTDTLKTGLLANEKVYGAINKITYKQDLWMVSTEKMFIKGIFQNFSETTSESDEPGDELQNDTLSETPGESEVTEEKLSISNIYKSLDAVSFSAKMDSDLKFLIQGECVSEETAKYLRSILSGLITVARLSNTGKQKSPTAKLFDNMSLERYDNSVFLDLKVDDGVLQELRKTNLMNEPETN
jgi:hypothetical protein